MNSNKPYLIRAMHTWISDNNLTPFILVDSRTPGAQIPQDFVSPNGQIVLNISEKACKGLTIANDRIVFSATFDGVPQQLYIPPLAVLAIYAKENNRGMVFGPENEADPGDEESGDGGNNSTPTTGKKKPDLKVVK